MNIEQVKVEKPISDMVYDMSWADYRAFAGLNASSLKAGLDGDSVNASRIKWSFEHQSEDTEEMLFGRALHCMMFEPSKFEARFCAYDGVRNHRHAAYREFLESHEGYEIMKAEGAHSIASAIEASALFLGCKEVTPLIREGKPEVTILGAMHGLQLKARIDWIATAGVMVDMKTTKSVSPESFGRQFFSLHYDVQLGLYWHLLAERVCRMPVQVIAVENKPPYEVVVYDVPESVLEMGLSKASSAIEKVSRAIDSGEWPGYANGVAPLFVPNWAMEESVEWSEEA